ncbi:hypothetical protein F6P71_11010 [Streptococcus suis]|nr:hypothetical protein [Streptococcus suis]
MRLLGAVVGSSGNKKPKASGLIFKMEQILKIVSAFAFNTPRSRIERIVVYGISFSIENARTLPYLFSINLFNSISFIIMYLCFIHYNIRKIVSKIKRSYIFLKKVLTIYENSYIIKLWLRN